MWILRRNLHTPDHQKQQSPNAKDLLIHIFSFYFTISNTLKNLQKYYLLTVLTRFFLKSYQHFPLFAILYLIVRLFVG